MDGAAAEAAAVVALAAVAAGSTTVLPGTVDRAEGRSGQRDEEPGTVLDCGGDVLAAGQARANEVVGIARVEAGAGGADGRTSVAAADGEPFAGFGASVVVVDDLAGRRVQSGGRAGQMDRVGAAAGCGDLRQPAGELGVLGDADGVAVCFGELTQARRTVEDGAPVSRSEFRGDGGDLPGWAAAAARVRVGGAQWVMGIAPCVVGWCGWRVSGWFRCPGRRGSGGAVRSRSCGPRRPCRPGTSRGSWAWSCVLSAQVWEKPLMTQVTSPWTVKSTGVWPR